MNRLQETRAKSSQISIKIQFNSVNNKTRTFHLHLSHSPLFSPPLPLYPSLALTLEDTTKRRNPHITRPMTQRNLSLVPSTPVRPITLRSGRHVAASQPESSHHHRIEYLCCAFNIAQIQQQLSTTWPCSSGHSRGLSSGQHRPFTASQNK